MKQSRLIILCFFGMMVISCAEARAYVGMYKGIEIIGKEAYVGRVKGALQLIEKKAPDAWMIVHSFLKKIEEGDKTGMFPYLPQPLAVVSSRAAACSLTWCVSAVIHDSFQAKLYQDYKVKNGVAVPDEAWRGSDAQKSCVAFQLLVMRQVGAPYDERKYLESCVETPLNGGCLEECPYG